MSATITSSAGVILTPDLVLGFSSTRGGGSLVHEILGRPDPDVTLLVKGSRSGTFSLLFIDEAKSIAAEQELSKALTYTLVTGERTSVDMRFVAPGITLRTLDVDTRDVWVLDVDYREIPAT